MQWIDSNFHMNRVARLEDDNIIPIFYSTDRCTTIFLYKIQSLLDGFLLYIQFLLGLTLIFHIGSNYKGLQIIIHLLYLHIILLHNKIVLYDFYMIHAIASLTACILLLGFFFRTSLQFLLISWLDCSITRANVTYFMIIFSSLPCSSKRR